MASMRRCEQKNLISKISVNSIFLLIGSDRMNRRAQGRLSFYRLAMELYNESQNMDLQMELLCGGRKLPRYQQKQTKIMPRGGYVGLGEIYSRGWVDNRKAAKGMHSPVWKCTYDQVDK